MNGSSGGQSVTELLLAWRGGDREAFDLLVERVYPELRRIAGGRLKKEPPEGSLSPTGLVHEAYMRLAADGDVDWRCRAHFYAVASNVMRRVLVERARARKAQKRQGIQVPMREEDAASTRIDVDVLDLDSAMERLGEEGHEREVRVVELCFFGGLSQQEAAEHLGVSRATVARSWSFARSWLYRELVR